jgi:formylglycine-generating enzyme required for sulfatase activity
MMKKQRVLKLIGIITVLMMQWSLYGCGGGGSESGSGIPQDEPPSERVIRSSSYLDMQRFVRVSMRDFARPDFKASNLGFRLAFSADESQTFAPSEEFVLVEGGCFLMGDNFGDGEIHELPVHEVCVDSFYIGIYPVTQGQWEMLMGRDPSYVTTCDAEDCPVVRVSWNEIQEYLKSRNKSGESSYRLPTEAEWEYAARSRGKKEKYAGTSEDSELGAYAWYLENSEKKAHQVGLKLPNSLGIFDMSGNVMEWVHDWYGPYPTNP